MTLRCFVWQTFSCFRLKFIVVVRFFFFSPKHRRALNFRLDFLIKKGKVGVWLIIYLMQNVYKFILLFPKTCNFIFGDVISMWVMSFVFKNGCMYELDH